MNPHAIESIREFGILLTPARPRERSGLGQWETEGGALAIEASSPSAFGVLLGNKSPYERYRTERTARCA